jgi:uncharacterized surface anchored protein
MERLSCWKCHMWTTTPAAGPKRKSSWASKKQKSVTPSSSEAEYVSAAMHIQETRFQQMLLDEIDTNIYPSVMYEDNQGCIYLVKNMQVGSRTKHISVRMHWGSEMKWKREE